MTGSLQGQQDPSHRATRSDGQHQTFERWPVGHKIRNQLRNAYNAFDIAAALWHKNAGGIIPHKALRKPRIMPLAVFTPRQKPQGHSPSLSVFQHFSFWAICVPSDIPNRCNARCLPHLRQCV
jgi:hypothetical protein